MPPRGGVLYPSFGGGARHEPRRGDEHSRLRQDLLAADVERRPQVVREFAFVRSGVRFGPAVDQAVEGDHGQFLLARLGLHLLRTARFAFFGRLELEQQFDARPDGRTA